MQQVNTQTHVGQEQAVLSEVNQAEPWFILWLTAGLWNIQQTLLWLRIPAEGGTFGKSILLTCWWRCAGIWAESAGSSGRRRKRLLGSSTHTACVISINQFSGQSYAFQFTTMKKDDRPAWSTALSGVTRRGKAKKVKVKGTFVGLTLNRRRLNWTHFRMKDGGGCRIRLRRR